MPGRFKISGSHYIADWGGNAANAGTDPTLPLANPSNVPNTANHTIVVGTGTYKFINNLTNQTRTWIGDGKVIFDANGFQFSGSAYQTCNNIKFKNFKGSLNALRCLNGTQTFTDCIFENCDFTPSSGGAFRFDRSIILPSDITPQVSNTYMIISSILLQTLQVAAPNIASNRWSGSYIAKDVILVVNSAQAFTNTNDFDNACINGKIERNGILYELKKFHDGSTRTDADPGILDIITVFPNVYTRGNFACLPEDVKFLDLENKIVDPTSHLLKRTFGGLYVGAVRPGRLITLDNPNFQFSYTRIDTSNPLSVKVAAGQVDGEIRITGKISDSLVSSRFFGLRALLAYFKGATAGTAENNNVPDGVKQLGLLSSEIDKPRRLTYFMRTSLDPNANQASPASIWDNDGAGEGTWMLMEVDTQPAHVAGAGMTYGNGDPRGGGALGTSFNFRSIDIRVVLDQDRD